MPRPSQHVEALIWQIGDAEVDTWFTELARAACLAEEEGCDF